MHVCAAVHSGRQQALLTAIEANTRFAIVMKKLTDPSPSLACGQSARSAKNIGFLGEITNVLVRRTNVNPIITVEKECSGIQCRLKLFLALGLCCNEFS